MPYHTRDWRKVYGPKAIPGSPATQAAAAKAKAASAKVKAAAAKAKETKPKPTPRPRAAPATRPSKIYGWTDPAEKPSWATRGGRPPAYLDPRSPSYIPHQLPPPRSAAEVAALRAVRRSIGSGDPLSPLSRPRKPPPKPPSAAARLLKGAVKVGKGLLRARKGASPIGMAMDFDYLRGAARQAKTTKAVAKRPTTASTYRAGGPAEKRRGAAAAAKGRFGPTRFAAARKRKK